MELEAFRKNLQTLVNIPDVEWIEFAKHLTVAKFSKNQFFAKEALAHSQLGFVVKGLFRVFHIDEEGREIILKFANQEDFLGNYSTIYANQGISKLSVQAIEPSVVVQMNPNIFEAFYSRHSCWQELGRKAAERCCFRREAHLMQLLQSDAKNRLKWFKNNFPDLSNRVPQKYLASFLGITPVSLSRIVSQM